MGFDFLVGFGGAYLVDSVWLFGIADFLFWSACDFPD